jgi:transcriptional repressor NrdR
MKCPFCGHIGDKVVDSRESREGETVRRRRECLACGRRFTTYEKVEAISYKVVKNDGTRQEFDREKLLRGLEKAVQKRRVSPSQLAGIVDEVEGLLSEREDREMSTRDVGAFVMERLKELDQVAYVRFASVYRRFEDVG